MAYPLFPNNRNGYKKGYYLVLIIAISYAWYTFFCMKLVFAVFVVRLKCPLQSTNKRFLLNTLRSTGLHDRSSKSRERHSSRNSDLRSKSYDRSPGRSRSPHREDRRHEGHRESKKYQRDSHRNKDKKEDKERSHKHRDNKDKRHGKDRHSRRGPREWSSFVCGRNTVLTRPSSSQSTREDTTESVQWLTRTTHNTDGFLFTWEGKMALIFFFLTFFF